MIIVFIGPDGCGKTTIIDLVQSEVFTDQPVEEYTLTFGILPSLSSILGRKRIIQEEGEAGAGMVPALSWFRCFILSIWYGIDLVLGRSIAYRKKAETTIIFSRFYMDFFYQRAYRRAFLPLLRLFLFLGPKPDYIFVLKRSAQEIFVQKPELDIEEIRHQYARISQYLSTHKGYMEIDASNGIETTVQNVLLALEA